jgi:adenylate cyclase
LAPDDSWVLSLRAGVAHLAKEFDDADRLSIRALARDPYHAWAVNRRGWVHEAFNRWDDAIPYFARIEHIKAPYFDHAESASGIGTAHFAARRYDLAEQWLRQASLVRPDDPSIHAALSSCYLQLRDKPAARRAAAVVRRVRPDVTIAEFLASYPCPSSPFKEALANGLVEGCMPP